MVALGRCSITALMYAGDMSIATAFSFVLERLSFFQKGSRASPPLDVTNENHGSCFHVPNHRQVPMPLENRNPIDGNPPNVFQTLSDGNYPKSSGNRSSKDNVPIPTERTPKLPPLTLDGKDDRSSSVSSANLFIANQTKPVIQKARGHTSPPIIVNLRNFLLGLYVHSFRVSHVRVGRMNHIWDAKYAGAAWPIWPVHRQCFFPLLRLKICVAFTQITFGCILPEPLCVCLLGTAGLPYVIMIIVI
jgi:hypothetical protein